MFSPLRLPIVRSAGLLVLLAMMPATAADRPGQQKAIAAMVRAGHDFNRARRIVSAPPGVIPDRDED